MKLFDADRFERFLGFLKKEMLQVRRDPSSFLIAGVIPVIMILLFSYGMSLDNNKVKLGVVLEDTSSTARSLAAAFENTPYFDVKVGHHRTELENNMVATKLRGLVIIPADFSSKILSGTPANIQILADGSEPNTAIFVQNYSEGVISTWLTSKQIEQGQNISLPIQTQSRVWFNPELKTRNSIVPGSIAVVMALIGTLLTALVVAKEWERGTMEAIMATPIRIYEMIIAKIIPYYLLGICSMVLCFVLATVVCQVPFRGSIFVLFIATSLFLVCSLALGLLISSVAKDQFVAGQFALMISFLPPFLLSGFLFEIKSMPLPLQLLTYVLPPRYFVTILQTTFIAGTVWSLFIPNMLAMVAIATVLLWLVSKRMVKRID